MNSANLIAASKPPKKKKFNISPFRIVIFALLVLYAITLFLPLLWGVNISLKTNLDAVAYPFSVKWPFRFENYKTVFNDFFVPINMYDKSGMFVGTEYYYIENMLWFTFLYAVCCSFANIAVVCVVAYITARFKFKICKIVDAIVIVAMILPIVGSMASELRIMRALGFYNSLIGMMIMKANFLGGTNFLIFKATFKSMPKDFSEAAQIDGASNLTVMLKIILPLAKNMFFTLWLLMFIQFWNDYQTPLLYFPSKPTLSYGLYTFTQATTGSGKEFPIKMAACFILMVPILIIFLFTSEKLIGNVSMGGLKE